VWVGKWGWNQDNKRDKRSAIITGWEKAAQRIQKLGLASRSSSRIMANRQYSTGFIAIQSDYMILSRFYLPQKSEIADIRENRVYLRRYVTSKVQKIIFAYLPLL
jgi:hypothetical protein